ncbi:NYN domain-containing protein [Methylomarinum sp. Ch1-1]|uniref:NYN domain-containing protein n=1 Tax=Methylomarinum roseum TaxID=3067653 RepID=A0AAU7NZQ9_9GAMM
MEKIAIFADVQNIYYTTREHFGRQFNYRAFWKKACAGREVVSAYAYAIDRGDAKQRGFQNTLKNIGFQVKLKPYIQRSDGSAKGDWDVGITLDMIEQAANVDTLILLSGDGDFDLLLQKARQVYGVRTEVYGVSSLTAPSLINAADRFFPINEALLM